MSDALESVHLRAHIERERLLSGPYDLAVVGGGINGAGIALDAALRGKSVALFDQGDFGQGTSSQSSKMLHGGIRYLEQLRFPLVYEALRERHLLLKLAPHLARGQSFVIPVYENVGRPLWMIRLGLAFYNWLACCRGIGKARHLTKSELLERVPELIDDGLVGGGLYYDAVMDDARLCLANVIGALEAGQKDSVTIRNYSRVTHVQPGTPARVQLEDLVTGMEHKIEAHHVVRALGPWTEPKHLVRSKGIHLLMPAFPMQDGVLMSHSKDQRVFFLIPWRGSALVGTTETPCGDPADEIRVEPEEVRYLLDELRRLFPRLQLNSTDIIGTFAGIRPLARESSRNLRKTGAVSRVHKIVEEGNVLTVFGGKYTTYRAVARDVVDRIFPGSVCSTHRTPLPGAEGGTWEVFLDRFRATTSNPIEESVLRRLYDRYGCRARAIIDLWENSALAAPLAEGVDETVGEVVYGIHNEFVVYPEDFLRRRTALRFTRDGGRSVYDAVDAAIERFGASAPRERQAARSEYFRDLEWQETLCTASSDSRA